MTHRDVMNSPATNPVTVSSVFVELLCPPPLPQGFSNSTMDVLLLAAEVSGTVIGETPTEHTDFKDHGTC